MHCTTCDALNDASAQFCRMCGAGLGKPPAIATAAPPSPPRYATTYAPMTGPLCSSCRQTNPAGAKYCVFCATPIAERALVTTKLVPAATPSPVVQPVYVTNVTQVYTTPPMMVVQRMRPQNLLARAVWFFMIGWWLSLIWTIFATLFNLTLIGMPVGKLMLNALPTVMTLGSRRASVAVVPPGALLPRPVEHPLAVRLLWFIFIGWWATMLWTLVAWAFCASLLFDPVGTWMFARVPAIMTLASEDGLDVRYYQVSHP